MFSLMAIYSQNSQTLGSFRKNPSMSEDWNTVAREIRREVRRWRFRNGGDHVESIAPEATVYSGEFIYSWPYRWIPDLAVYKQLVDRLSADVLKYTLRRLKWPDNFDPQILITDSIWMGTFCSKWADEAEASPRVYRKLFLYNVYFYTLFVLDDSCEKLAGDPRHTEFVRCVGRILQKIYLLKYESVDDIEADPLLATLKEVPSFKSGLIFIFFDVANDMKLEFDIAPMTGVARHLRQTFELQTWFESNDNSHFLDLKIRDELRTRTIGMAILAEFIMVMDGIHPTANIRENFYFRRFYRSAETLGYLINDILSVLKELQEARETGHPVDNYILILMDLDKLTFKQALDKTLKEHNTKVVEYKSEVERLLADDGFLIDLDDEEKKTFWHSVDYIGVIIGCIIQTHLKMSRYKNKAKYEFADL